MLIRAIELKILPGAYTTVNVVTAVVLVLITLSNIAYWLVALTSFHHRGSAPGVLFKLLACKLS
jgi:hypothetical protein